MSETDKCTCKKGKWTTVADWWGTMPAELKMTVTTSKKVRWRVLGAVPGAGKFKKCKKTWYLFNGVAQVKSMKEDTRCTSTLKPMPKKK